MLSSARRREILRLCWDAPCAAGRIHEALADVTFGAVSQHLAALRAAGLVTVEAKGRTRLYRARREALGPFRAWLEQSWNDSLYRLQLAAELEAGRRGPRPTPRKRRTRSAPRTSRP